ncbi:MAG: SMC family ATPase [Butyricicoccus sp.]|nr:SMC family ATPase [Butyricicoccus sp.]
MRPLKLTISAFASYAGRVELELERLGERGLYLITGDTGSGKTTIFDAITYALYGEPSGEARDAAMLRSMYAAPDTPTAVELTFAYGGREYTVRRSPEYERPARRGGGTVVQKAVSELYLPGGGVLTKNREVNAKLVEIIGLDRGQFSQIAMLAQGDFRKLLLAGTGERQKIFRELFGTGRYMELQERLKEEAAKLREQCAATRQSARQYIGSVQCRSGDELAPGLEKAKAGELPDGETVELIRALIARDERETGVCVAAMEKLDAEWDGVKALLQRCGDAENTRRKLEQAARERERELEAVKLAERELSAQREKSQRREQLARELAALEAELPRYQELEARRGELSGLEKLISGQSESLTRKEQAARELERELEKLRQEAQALSALPELSARLAGEKLALEGRSAALKALEKDARDWEEYSAQLGKLDENCGALSREMERGAEEISSQSEALNVGRELWSASEGLEAERERLLAMQKEQLGREKELGELSGLLDECGAAAGSERAAQEEYALAQGRAGELQAEYNRKNRAFLDEQAGILALSLSEGEPCPVCGSVHHPSPAHLSEGAPSEAEVNELREKLELAQREASGKSREAGSRKSAREEKESQLLRRLAAFWENPELEGAAGFLGSCRGETRGKLAELREQLLELEAQSLHREELGRQLESGQERLKQLAERQEERRGELERAERERSVLSGQREQLELRLCEQLRQRLDGCALADASGRIAGELDAAARELAELETRIAETQAGLDRKRELETLLPQREQGLGEAKDAVSLAQRELAGAQASREVMEKQLALQGEGLRCADESAARELLESMGAEAAELSGALKAAEAAVNSAREELAGTQSAIAELEKLLSEAGELDAGALKEKSEALSRSRSGAEARHREIFSRLNANRTALENIDKTFAALEAQEEKYTWVRALADTANGKLAGREKLALETYVQTTFFDRILLRANRRLMEMSDGQYELKRRHQAQNNRSQSGLELDVVDHYNASERSAASLSGGESFMASLSLALGLADEVQSEAGGIRLDTMFVDEGFGTLDGKLLDQAVGALIKLTEGNRLVGIISHVEGLKGWIDKQLVVSKDRSGGSRAEIVV